MLRVYIHFKTVGIIFIQETFVFLSVEVINEDLGTQLFKIPSFASAIIILHFIPKGIYNSDPRIINHSTKIRSVIL